MIAGHAVGDVLGNSFAFHAPGQGTSSTEFTLALLSSLEKNNCSYNLIHVINQYIKVGNYSRCLVDEASTLFLNCKTVEEYKHRFKSMYSDAANTWPEGISFLLRAVPFALLDDDHCVEMDTCITNPGQINCAFAYVYVYFLKQAVHGYSGKKIVDDAISKAKTKYPRASSALNSVVSGCDITNDARKVLHELIKLVQNPILLPKITSVVRNATAPIISAYIGARFGIKHLLKNDPELCLILRTIFNVDTLSQGDSPMPLHLTGMWYEKLLNLQVQI